MRVLVLGADGFIGKQVATLLSGRHEVVGAVRDINTTPGRVYVDLMKPKTIQESLRKVRPEVVINCAGIVENSSRAEMNVKFTKNLLNSVLKSRIAIKKIIILGSASEYGIVKKLPVDENTPRLAASGYGLSKMKEVDLAFEYKEKHKLPIVVARIFNPIGEGMHPKFLVPQIASQIKQIKNGQRSAIRVSRLDSARDYLDVRDVASAIASLAENKNKEAVYNIGSGQSTTNEQLIRLMIANSRLSKKPPLIETSSKPEPQAAVLADITRITNELGWRPSHSLEDSIKGLMNLTNDKIKILIIGAGKAGQLVFKDIANDVNSPFEVVGFVDDDTQKQGAKIEGADVIGTISDLKRLILISNVDEIFITIPSERGKIIRRIVQETTGTKVAYKILPRLPEILMQDFKEDYIRHIRKVRAEDLLGGEILKSDQQLITSYAQGKTIMITGAAGSIGSELSRQMAAHGAKKLVLFDWWENGMFELRNQLIENWSEQRMEFVIGDINDSRKIDQLMKFYKPDTVFHAAAYKHVPLMEHNPSEAIKNNIKGTRTVAEAAVKNKVKKFVLVSSDKAVNPTNIMGATKRAAEKIIHILAESQKDTTFCAVRFGNVINSNGSAIPIFEQQIEKGGPVTVTHREITRFFMTIPEAVHLILQSWVMGKNNDLFVLDMGEPIKIYDLARLLIAVQGYEPEKEIKIKIIGLRPGEKLYEEVLVKQEEVLSTSINKVFRTKNYMDFDRLQFINNLNLLLDSVQEDGFNATRLKAKLQEMVPTYRPQNERKVATDQKAHLSFDYLTN